jgi:thiol-disulfide isomerase/thioredoxin
MKALLKFILPLAGILAVVIGALTLIKGQNSRTPGEGARPEIQLGASLPDFDLHPFGSDKTVPASELKAKIVLVNFWATWCEACMVEMPSIIKLRNLYKDRGFEVVAVNVDENPEAVLPQTLKDLGINFPVYIDAGNKLSDLFDVHAIPMTVIMDKNRTILLIESGERDWAGNDVRTQIEQWLAG